VEQSYGGVILKKEQRFKYFSYLQSIFVLGPYDKQKEIQYGDRDSR